MGKKAAGAAGVEPSIASRGAPPRPTPVCFLPGAAGRAEHGARLVAAVAVARGGEAVALDWPCSGDSTGASPCWSTEALAVTAWEVIAALGWSRVVLVGHSLGAMVATRMAEDPRAERALLLSLMPGPMVCLTAGFCPFPPRSVVALVRCALTLCRPSAAASQGDMNLAWLEHGLERKTLHGERLESAVAAFTPRAAAPAGALVWLRRRLGDVAAVVSILRHGMKGTRDHAVQKQGQLHGGRRCRATVVHGGEDQLIVPAAGRLAAALWPTEEYYEWPRSGHFVHLDSPDLLPSLL